MVIVVRLLHICLSISEFLKRNASLAARKRCLYTTIYLVCTSILELLLVLMLVKIYVIHGSVVNLASNLFWIVIATLTIIAIYETWQALN